MSEQKQSNGAKDLASTNPATTTTTTMAVENLKDDSKTIHELRVEIDRLYGLSTNLYLDNGRPAKGYTVAISTALVKAKAWLGKFLGELGVDSPYSENKKTVADIEPTADTTDSVELKATSYIENLSTLRNEIQTLIGIVKDLDIKSTREAAICRTNAWTYLVEAKMEVGFEFQRLRNS